MALLSLTELRLSHVLWFSLFINVEIQTICSIINSSAVYYAARVTFESVGEILKCDHSNESY